MKKAQEEEERVEEIKRLINEESDLLSELHP